MRPTPYRPPHHKINASEATVYIAGTPSFYKHKQLLSRITTRLSWLRNRQRLQDPPTIDEGEDCRLIDLSGLSSSACAELIADYKFSRILADQPVIATPEYNLDIALNLRCKMGATWWPHVGTVVVTPKSTKSKLLDICLRRLFENFLQHNFKRYEAVLAGKRVLLIRPISSSMRCFVAGLTPDGRLCEAAHPSKHPQRILHAFQMATVENYPVPLNRATTDASFPSAHTIILTKDEFAAVWEGWKASPAKRRAES
jgi:hypothetical protein